MQTNNTDTIQAIQALKRRKEVLLKELVEVEKAIKEKEKSSHIYHEEEMGGKLAKILQV